LIIGDFHTHINGGGDRVQNARFLAKKAVESGFTHIALGCHEWICPMQLKQLIEFEFKIKVVRFAECWCEFDDHLLALNIGDARFYTEKYKPIEWYIDYIHGIGGKAVLAHPDTQKTFERVKHLLDGVEIINGRSGGYGYVKDSGLQLFQNSDFHVWEDDKDSYGKLHTILDDNWFGILK